MRFGWRSLSLCALFAVGLAACGNNSTTPNVGPGPHISAQGVVALPNLLPGGKFTYDIGVTDAAARRYYLADRTNSSLDILDLNTMAVRQVGGFVGQKASNDNSGPDGVVFVPGASVYVGDVNVVKVVDPVAGTVTKTITTGTATFAACRTYRKPDITVSEDPRTTSELARSTIA